MGTTARPFHGVSRGRALGLPNFFQQTPLAAELCAFIPNNQPEVHAAQPASSSDDSRLHSEENAWIHDFSLQNPTEDLSFLLIKALIDGLSYRTRCELQALIDGDLASFLITLLENFKFDLQSREVLESLAFAQWAFGPKGLPQLGLIACGVFVRGTAPESLFYRNTHIKNGMPKIDVRTYPVQLNFRQVSSADTSLKALLEEEGRFIEAVEAS